MRILLVVHGFPPHGTGGTEIYTHGLAQALAADARDEVVVLTRDADPARPEYDLRRASAGPVRVLAINNTFRRCSSLEDSYRNPGLLAVALPLLDDIRPDVAHFQHLTCLSTGLPEALASRRVPTVLTLNDYWLLCHRGQLLDRAMVRCDGPGESGCQGCIPPSATVGAASFRAAQWLKRSPALDPLMRSIAGRVDRQGAGARARQASLTRLRHMREAVRHVDLVLAPSQTMESKAREFGIPSCRLERCNQGIRRHPRPHAVDTRRRPLKAAFAGSTIPSKAPHIFIDAAGRLPAGSIEVHVLGSGRAYHGDDSYAAMFATFLERPFVRNHGGVPHDDVRPVLETCDVLVVPSIWIENAPFVIKEAFDAGLPVVASDLGGMSELVEHEVNGLLFAAGDPESLARQLRRLLDDPSLLAKLGRGVKPPRSIEEEAAELRGRYRRLVNAGAAAVRPPVASRSSPRVAAVVLNFHTPDQTWLAVRSLASSFRVPDEVIVVNNGGELPPMASVPGSSGCDREAVRVIDPGRNLGFAGGVNAGILDAFARSADFVLLVNSDAVLEPDALDSLLQAANRDASAGILAPLLLTRVEPWRVASAGIDYSESTGRVRSVMTGALAADMTGEPFEVSAVSGCVMLIRRAAFEAVGGFDSEYFFSFEDVDLCLRARRAGHPVLCVPRARAHHEGSHSIGKRSSRRIYFATRNHLRLAASLEPLTLRRLMRGAFIVVLNAAYVLTSPDAPLVAGLAAVARGTRDHILGRYGVGPAA